MDLAEGSMMFILRGSLVPNPSFFPKDNPWSQAQQQAI
jgi:hypothetical protein